MELVSYVKHCLLVMYVCRVTMISVIFPVEEALDYIFVCPMCLLGVRACVIPKCVC